MTKKHSKIMLPLPLFGVLFIQPFHANGTESMSRSAHVTDLLKASAHRNGPGIQYVVVNKARVLYEHCIGLANVESKTPLSLNHAMAAFSMTKTITANFLKH